MSDAVLFEDEAFDKAEVTLRHQGMPSAFTLEWYLHLPSVETPALGYFGHLRNGKCDLSSEPSAQYTLSSLASYAPAFVATAIILALVLAHGPTAWKIEGMEKPEGTLFGLVVS